MFKFFRRYFSEFASTEKLHKKFDFPRADIRDPGILTEQEFNFRFKFLQEELQEFKDAYEDDDEIKMLDALLDLVIVAHGTACFMGISKELWRDCFDAVNEANAKKVRGVTKNRGSISAGYDLVKPAGWQSPNQKIADLYLVKLMKNKLKM